jgi:hypothetical protein
MLSTVENRGTRADYVTSLARIRRIMMDDDDGDAALIAFTRIFPFPRSKENSVVSTLVADSSVRFEALVLWAIISRLGALCGSILL